MTLWGSESRWLRQWNRWHLHPWGLIGATIMFTLGLTPSLLPRDWFYQGLVSGVGAGIGYLLGLGAWVIWTRWLSRHVSSRIDPGWRQLSDRTRAGLEFGLIGLSLMWLLAVVVFSLRWQRGIAEITNSRPFGLWEYLLVLPTGLVVFLIVVWCARTLRRFAHWIAARFSSRIKHLGRLLAAWAAVLLLGGVFIEQVIPGTIVGVGEQVFSARHASPEEGSTPPFVPERSGSPHSHTQWEGLGMYGTRFVNQGLSAEELAKLTGGPAKEPIRVYAGLGNAPTDTQRAELVIAELERTDAASREALALVVTTGTGWVNHKTSQAFELLHNGDSAIAATQYSALPSPLHFFAGAEAIQGVGRDFVIPIVDWWNELPQATRPKLYLYGESLGSTGIEAAFSGMRDIANSVDGIFLTGPPRFNPLHTQLTERRDAGTTAVAPEYSGGLVVRFANNAEQVREWAGHSFDQWGSTRMLYVQHASDPISWWSPELILREPDWLKEPAGPDRLPAMQWMPFITFLQVSADLPVSQNVPDGHGHNYGAEMLDGFAAIAGPDRFTTEEVDRLQPLLREAIQMTGDDRFD